MVQRRTRNFLSIGLFFQSTPPKTGCRSSQKVTGIPELSEICEGNVKNSLSSRRSA